MKAKIKLIIEADVELTHIDSEQINIRLMQQRFFCEPDENIEKYLIEGDRLNKTGHEVLDELTLGTIGVAMHVAHQSGLIDSAAHLRDIIQNLENKFVNEPTNLKTGIVEESSS